MRVISDAIAPRMETSCPSDEKPNKLLLPAYFVRSKYVLPGARGGVAVGLLYLDGKKKERENGKNTGC